STVVASPILISRQPPLQDHCSRGAVDVFARDPAAPLAGRTLSLERRGRFQRGPALIDQVHGKAEPLLELGRESAGCWRDRAGAAVDIIRCADDQPPRLQRSYLTLDRAPVRLTGLGA